MKYHAFFLLTFFGIPAGFTRTNNPVPKQEINLSGIIDSIYCRRQPSCRGIINDSLYVICDYPFGLISNKNPANGPKINFIYPTHFNTQKMLIRRNAFSLLTITVLHRSKNKILLNLKLDKYDGSEPNKIFGIVLAKVDERNISLCRAHDGIYCYKTTEALLYK